LFEASISAREPCEVGTVDERCHISDVRKHLPLVVGVLVVLAGCGGGTQGGSDSVVYKVSVTVSKLPPTLEPQDPGLSDFEQVEWVWPSAGAFRIEREAPAEPGSSEIAREATVCAWSACMRLASYRDRPSVRIGSLEFIRQWREASFALEPLRRQVSRDGAAEEPTELVARRGGVEFRLVIEGQISPAEAERRNLFDIPAGPDVDLDRELEVGERPTLPVKAYWFGPTLEHRQAVAAREHRLWGSPPGLYRPGRPSVTETAHVTFYVPPSEREKSNAVPGLDEYAEDEVQVFSQPLSEPIVERTLKSYDGLRLTGATHRRVPRVRITLANGETATLFFTGNEETKGFSVLTEMTLVSVHGFRFNSKDAVALGRQLRPL
jgi:hypothetical protein